MLLQAKILKRILLSYITTINHVNLSKVFIFGGGGEGVNSMLTRVLVNKKKRNQSNYKGVFASFKAINVSEVGKNLLCGVVFMSIGS